MAWPIIAGAAIGAISSLFGGRQQQEASNAQAAAQMQFERENMFHQNQVAYDMRREERGWEEGQAQVARDWNAGQADITRDFNAEQAQLNRDFQERMSNTQWQRGAADMAAAGFNPMLAYSQGGASSPGGGAASSSAASTSAPSSSTPGPGAMARGTAAPQINYLSQAVSSALQGATTVAGLDNLRAETEVKRNEALRILADIPLKNAQARETSARAISREVDSRVDAATEERKYLYKFNEPVEQGSRISESAQRIRESVSREQLNKYEYAEGEAMQDYWRSEMGRNSPYLRQGAELAADIAGTFASSAFGLRAMRGVPGGGLRRR